MRSIRVSLLVAGATLALTLGVPTVSASSTPHELHLIKDCSTFNAVAPTYCSIRTSDFVAIPIGTKVWYTGPIVNDTFFLSSNVTLDAEDGNTATGYCILETKTTVGMCTFWEGVGTLAGFHAIIDVSVDAAGAWHWDGTYYISDAVSAVPKQDSGLDIVLDTHEVRPR
jgi:hypothetical protein